MGCRGLRTSTVQLCSGTKRVGSLVTEGDNPDRDVNQQPAGYDVRRAATCPSCAEGAQDGLGVGVRYKINCRGIESTCFHGPNMGICESVLIMSDG